MRSMDRQKICERLEQTTYRVKAYEGEEVFSTGTAFCFNKHGSLITAAHVLDNGKPFRENEIVEKKIYFTAQRKKEIPYLYRTDICGIHIEWPNGPIKDQIYIDLAILSPVKHRQNVPYLKMNDDKRFVGQEVIMAGFPDEIEFPLKLDENLDREYLKDKQSDKELDYNLDQLQVLLMMQKSGMIGFTDDIIIGTNNPENFKLVVGVDYIDNGMHSGASGGPIVNDNGEVIGVISKRAVTRISSFNREMPSLEIPSGSTLSVSPKTIINFTEYIASERKF